MENGERLSIVDGLSIIQYYHLSLSSSSHRITHRGGSRAAVNRGSWRFLFLNFLFVSVHTLKVREKCAKEAFVLLKTNLSDRQFILPTRGLAPRVPRAYCLVDSSKNRVVIAFFKTPFKTHPSKRIDEFLASS